MRKSILYLAIGGLTLTGLNSCEDLENLCNIGKSDLATGEVFVSSLNQMMDVYKRVDEANKNLDLKNTGSATIDGAMCTKVGDSLIIDFGVSDVLCADSKLRRGSIRTKIVGDYLLPNGMVNAKLVNYFVENVNLQGTFDATNKGPLTTPLITIATLNFNEGDRSTIDYALSAQWGAGFDTPLATDDIFDVSGNINGTDIVNNKIFTVNVLQPLHYVNACPHIVEYGVMDIALTGDSTVSSFELDFIQSDGCNNLFRVSVDCEGSPIVFTYPFN